MLLQCDEKTSLAKIFGHLDQNSSKTGLLAYVVDQGFI